MNVARMQEKRVHKRQKAKWLNENFEKALAEFEPEEVANKQKQILSFRQYSNVG